MQNDSPVSHIIFPNDLVLNNQREFSHILSDDQRPRVSQTLFVIAACAPILIRLYIVQSTGPQLPLEIVTYAECPWVLETQFRVSTIALARHRKGVHGDAHAWV